MIGLIAFFGTIPGRLTVAGGIFAALITAWAAFAWHYEKKGEAKVLAKIEKSTAANVEKAASARRSIDNIPTSQLSDKYRRD